MTTSAPPPGGILHGQAPRLDWLSSPARRAACFMESDLRRAPGPLVLAGALTFAAVLSSGWQQSALNPAIAVPLAVLATAPLGVVRRFPGPAIAVVLLANLGFLVFAHQAWPVVAIACWLLALFASPLQLPYRQAVAAVVLTELAVTATYLPIAPGRLPWNATVIEAVTVLTAWGTGELLRSQRKSGADRAAAAEQLHLLAERDAIARERASIARELHDVVAHHVSMIAVRAATAPYAVDGIPPSGQAVFSEIADEARTALNELRVVLGALRAPGGQADAAPQPTITDVPGLIRRMASTGTAAELATTGHPRPLPGSVELCGYRIVQEALTNAGRHAPGRRVRVELAYTDEALAITVHSDSAGVAGAGVAGAGLAGAGGADPGEAGAAGVTPAGHCAGFGLTGLRERVAILGGTFEAGPDAAGFCVSAVLPASRSASAERDG